MKNNINHLGHWFNKIRMAVILSRPVPSFPNPEPTSSSSNFDKIFDIFFPYSILFFIHFTIPYPSLFYQIPSHPMMMNYTQFLSIFTTSGTQITICSRILRSLFDLKEKSPNALLKFKFSFILPCEFIRPPAANILFFSSEIVGLCSIFNCLASYLLSLLFKETTLRLSPALAQYMNYFVIRMTKAVAPATVSP